MQPESKTQVASSQRTATQRTAAQQPAVPPHAAQPYCWEKIHGWLLFFLLVLSLGVCYNFAAGIYGYRRIIPPFTSMDIYHSISNLIVCLYEIYVIYSFFKLKLNAVFLGKALFYIVVFGNIIKITFTISSHFYFTIALFCFTIFQAIWIFFLYGSEQVKRLYPKEKRHASGWDYFVVGAVFGLPIVFLIIALV
jgi:hypothetical protein